MLFCLVASQLSIAAYMIGASVRTCASPKMDIFSNYGALLSVFVVILITIFWSNYGATGGRRFPPGPRFALPLLGHLLHLGTKPHLTFLKWKETYGPLIYFKMGTKPAILVNDAKLMKELLSSSATTGRLQSAMVDVMSIGGHGVLSGVGRNWEEQRHHTVRVLRELGVGGRKGNLEEITLDEAKSLLNFFEKRVGQPIQGRRCFNGAVISNLWSIVTGQRFEWSQDGNSVNSGISRKSCDITECANKAAKSGLVFLSWLRYIAPERLGWNKFVDSMAQFHEFMENTVNEQEATLDINHPRHLIDHFLIRIQGMEDPNSTFYKDTGRSNLKVVLADLFIAGSETTSTTLEFAMLYLSQHPDVQRRLQREVDEVLGSKMPSLADRTSLPYTQAVIMEISRHSAAVSMSLHGFTEDFHFRQYFFPKDTLLLVDVYSALHSPQVWGPDVNTFRPGRFLNEDQTQIVHREGFLPFGSGKRNCIGESLAKDTLFLFLTSIFQKFTVELYPKGTKVDYNDVVAGFTMEPRPFEICVNLREA